MPDVLDRARRRALRMRDRAVLMRDIRALRRRNGAAFAPPETPPEGVVLLSSLSDFVYQLKLEGVLAGALRLRGYEPVALVPAWTSVPRAYFEALGVRRFVTLEQYADDELVRRAHEESQRLLAGSPGLGELKGLRFLGADVGRHALATVSRTLHQGGVDPRSPEVGAALETVLPSAVRAALVGERLLDDLRPDLVLFNERNYADHGPICDVALGRGIDVVQAVSAFRDDALVFKRYTLETKLYHPRSLSNESWELVRELPWTVEREREFEREFGRRYEGESRHARWNQGLTRETEPSKIVAQLGLDPARRTAVLFSHLLWDANMFYGRDLFADQLEWFLESVHAACRNDAVNWIVKLHPANVWKLRRDGFEGELNELAAIHGAIGELPPHVHVLPPDTPISTRSLFDLTAWGITIRGSVGFELPCFGVPVLTAGTGFYSGRGFTVDSDTPRRYLERLASIQHVPPLDAESVELARKHAYGLLCLRPLRFTSFESVFRSFDQAGHPLDHDLRIGVRTAEQLAAAADLRRFADWAVGSRALDYLEAPGGKPGVEDLSVSGARTS